MSGALTESMYVQPQTQLTGGTTYAEVAGTKIDAHGQPYRTVGYSVALPTSNYAAVVKVQGRIAQDDDGDWVDLKAFDETGTQHSSADVDIAAGGRKYLILTPNAISGAHSAFREYRVMAKAKNSDADTHVRVRGIAKM